MICFNYNLLLCFSYIQFIFYIFYLHLVLLDISLYFHTLFFFTTLMMYVIYPKIQRSASKAISKQPLCISGRRKIQCQYCKNNAINIKYFYQIYTLHSTLNISLISITQCLLKKLMHLTTKLL